MFLKSCFFHSNDYNGKKPNYDNKLRYNQLEESQNYSLILKDSNIIVLDIDDLETRALLSQNQGFLKDLVYEYKPESDSFHFFFKKDKMTDKFLKNNNNYASIANLKYEFKNQYITINLSNEWHNQNVDDLPSLSILFFPAYNDNGKWELFKGVQEKIDNLIDAKEKSGRSENMFAITDNLKRIITYAYDEVDLKILYEFYNENILADKLSNNEVKNNINQVLGDTKNNKKINPFNECVSDKNIDEYMFANIFVKEYKVIKYNSQIYVFYDNKYLIINKPYLQYADLGYHLIANIFENLSNKIKFSIQKYNEIINHIEMVALEYQHKDITNNFRVKNGVMVWQNDHYEYKYGNESKYKIFTNLDINYNVNINQNEKIDNWLKGVFNRNHNEAERDKQIQLFWEMVGTTLIDNNNSRSAFIFKGKGRNGKSTILQFIARFLGRNNISSLTYDQLTKEGFTLSDLRNKKANLCDEMPSSFDANNGVIKTLISGGIISTDIKFQPIAQWKNFATLIFATNYNLKVIKFNQAIIDRLVIFELINRYDINNDIKNLEQHLLQNETDYQYVLNQAIKGLTRLINNNFVFTETFDTFNNRLEMILDNEPIKNWLYRNGLINAPQYQKTIDFSLTEKFINQLQLPNHSKNELNDLLSQFKNWYKDYYGKESTYGLSGFKEKLREIPNINVITNLGSMKEMVIYEEN